MEAIEAGTMGVEGQKSIGDRLLEIQMRVDLEVLIYVGLLLVAVATRFFDLGTRVMSHDESLHTYYSWRLAEDGTFQHTPLMHGPLQFHLIAFTYFLFGATDATARFPAALASVLGIALLYGFRRWLGRWGALVAAALMTVSPFMLYYGRYARNEALVVPLALLMFYAVFRYFEDREPKWLYLLSASLALHFTAKETAFIYTAQLMLFLGLMLSWNFLRSRWDNDGLKTAFGLGLILILVGVILAGAGIYADSQVPTAGTPETVQPADPTAGAGEAAVGLHPALTSSLIVVILGSVLAVGSAVYHFRDRLRTEFPSFDILLISATVTLPQLAALPSTLLGWDPMAYEDPRARMSTAIVVIALLLIATAAGLAWNWRRWLIATGIFFGIFGLFYTTVLTHPLGFFTGLVGSLGYWLEQHGVNRGSQPLYYYLLIQVPIYEYLAALGALLAGWYGFRRWRGEGALGAPDERAGEAPGEETDEGSGADSQASSVDFPVIAFMGYMAVTSTLAYTIAGERMPWLTVHIALPYILLAGWAIGTMLRRVDWRAVVHERGWLMVALGLFGLLALARAVGFVLGPTPPFQGGRLDELRSTTGFLASLAVVSGCGVGIVYIARDWTLEQVKLLGGTTVFGLLFVLTMRTSFRAAFVNYDRATEYLVYAHSARGVKTVLNQIEELSRRTTDGMAIDLGYDDDVSWPYSWYVRNFSNAHFFAGSPTRDLLNYPVVIAGDNNWGEVEPILGNRYHQFEYIRMWWPMQDYFGLTWDRVWGALSSPEYRAALWDIWFNRDYTRYGRLTGTNFALEEWNPSDRMKLYIRKDIASLIWDYGVTAESLQEVSLEDPYEDGMTDLSAQAVIGEQGDGLGQLQNPRSVAFGPDGELYVADTGNHRIVVLDPDGEPQAAWGSFGGEVQPGGEPQLNEPWGLAVADDGSVYVADTWNHRIQRLSSQGEVLSSFGSYGASEGLDSFWGPRDVALDEEGRVFVADTGNKRIVVYDAQGQPVTSFGGGGEALGFLDEPVGLTIGPAGRVYVADTWNQRVQVFQETEGGEFEAVDQWPLEAWYGQSLDNKPYLDASPQGHVCLSDPEASRVLCFDEAGEFITGWGDGGIAPGQFGLPAGVAFDGEGNLWVVDSSNHRVMRFSPDLP